MSRPLKFRAWNEADKCWYNPLFIEMNLLGQAILHHGIEQFEIIPASAIEQYTGLKDKNGKEIYEGDILNSKLGKIYKISFSDGHTRWESSDGSNAGLFQDYINEFNMAVVGNIHENANLIREKGGDNEQR